MKDNLKDEFFIKEQLQSLIHVPVNNVTIDLSSYIYVDAILSQPPFIDRVKFYVKGFVKVNTNILSDGEGHACMHNNGNITSWQTYQCGEYCSRPDMNEITGLMLPIEENDIDQQIYYNFSEFKNHCHSIGLPIKDKSEIKYIKSFNYDTEQINQLSNFTVNQAILIASNWYFQNHIGLIPPLREEQAQLQEHNRDVLCECIKGQNQQGFHLITKELWCKEYLLDEEEDSSKHYKNGTILRNIEEIDLERTIISKNEFIRWCGFTGIETGLTLDDEVKNESAEFLKLEVERLKKLIPPPLQQRPLPTTPLQNDAVKLNVRTTNKTILISLGLMAWMLSSKSLKLSIAGKPNSSQIEEAIKNEVNKLNMINSDNDKHGIVMANLQRDISLAIKELKSALRRVKYRLAKLLTKLAKQYFG